MTNIYSSVCAVYNPNPFLIRIISYLKNSEVSVKFSSKCELFNCPDVISVLAKLHEWCTECLSYTTRFYKCTEIMILIQLFWKIKILKYDVFQINEWYAPKSSNKCQSAYFLQCSNTQVHTSSSVQWSADVLAFWSVLKSFQVHSL